MLKNSTKLKPTNVAINRSLMSVFFTLSNLHLFKNGPNRNLFIQRVNVYYIGSALFEFDPQGHQDTRLHKANS